jgi:CRP/FNR family transcriptional regulator, cyclic AMP receptor protein
MADTDLSGLIAPGSLFAGADEADLSAIAARASARSFDRGDTLMHQGDAGDCCYIITSGVVRVVLFSANGREITLDYLEAGAVVGEIALFDGLDRTATVIAHVAVETLRLDRSVLLAILADRPAFALKLLNQMALRLRQANATIESDRAFASGPRLARCLIRLMATGSEGKLRHDLNQTDLAQFAGMSREQINRQLSSWADDGVIERQGGKVRILDPDTLADIAESGE